LGICEIPSPVIDGVGLVGDDDGDGVLSIWRGFIRPITWGIGFFKECVLEIIPLRQTHAYSQEYQDGLVHDSEGIE